MADSQSNSKVFSVRIVSLDYYMAPPIPGFDVSYSSFHGTKVKEVPVIRIYGSTPAGQKACLHVHRVLPYLYIPCSDLGLQTDDEVGSRQHAVSLALEKSLKLKGNAGSKRQHVHGCSVVRARRFYGYHSSEELFMKIYFYYPQDVSRAANLLLAGAICDKVLQPYESHIPYLLQFLIDYNLYGMGHLHASKIKFRGPVPDVFSPAKAKHKDIRQTDTDDSNCTAGSSDLGSDTCLNLPIWISSTIPDGWNWQCSHLMDSSQNEDPLFKRQSTCELEGDVVVDEILNQQFISYAPLSQSHSEVKMVQSLIPIWEEELERTGVPYAMPSDCGKPPALDVLRILLGGIEFANFMEVENDGENFLTSKPLESTVRGNLVDQDLVNFESSNHLPPKYLNESDRRIGSLLSLDSAIQNVDAAETNELDAVNQLQVSSTLKLSNAPDEDALRLLKWLASSQAAEDINSDDELARETILSPLLPAKGIDKVLEKANVDYESESQQECQDILDSIDMLNFEELSNPEDNHSRKALSKQKIPQLDGSSDDLQSDPFADNSMNAKKKKAMPSWEVHSCPEPDSSSYKRRGKRPRKGTLPVSSQKASNIMRHRTLDNSDVYGNENKETLGTSFFGNEAERYPHTLKIDEYKDVRDSGAAKIMGGCSTRDLMRKKRSHRFETESCIDAVRWTQDANLEKKSKNDIEEETSFSPVDDLPATNEEVECHERNINPTASANEISGVKPISSCLPTQGNVTPPSIKNSTVLENLLENDNHGCLDRHGSSSCTLESCHLHENEIIGEDFGARNLLKTNAVGLPTVTSDSACKTGCKIEIESQSSRHVGKGAIVQDEHSNDDDTALFQFGRHLGLPNLLGSTSEILEKEVKPVGMTFCKKPPAIEWTDEPNDEAPVDECLPFFNGNCQETKQPLDVSPKTCESVHNQELVMGIPVLYQNDGSYLFMLTPAASPPSVECVDRWLSSDSCNFLCPISNERLSDMDSQNSEADVSNSPPVEFASWSDAIPNLDKPHHGNQEKGSIDIKPPHKGEENPSTECSQDNSQISGPERKSRSTPLSQIGFRDPASVGGGQQLTLLSIEVQAESRGDLRPDPRFDAINVVVLVFQEDNKSRLDVHVLLRFDSGSVSKNLDAVSECEVLVFTKELDLFNHFIEVIRITDPDVLMGWDVQSGSLGFLAERAAYLGIGLLDNISRTPSETKVASGDIRSSEKQTVKEMLSESTTADAALQNAIVEDEWGRTHASGVHVGGRIVLNIWRLMRNEVKLNMYTAETVAEAVLRRKIPSIPWQVQSKWYASGPARARYRAIEYILERAKLNLQIMSQLDMINRTSELARVFGIDFFSVLSRGSQYRVESMFLRLAHSQNYLAISPGNQQVANQPAMECLPLVMEPESSFYADPVIVLDFQSLYPSMVIAYNLCFCTCLGKVPPMRDILGVSSYSPDKNIFRNLKHELLVTPNGVAYVPSKTRKGVLPRLLEEILSTRIMVKQAMKKLAPSQQVLHRILNARQLALKLIANVTYGYTAAGFSGRMPCAELADSIVQCGRRTLEHAISFVNSNDKWKARVVYGDTDSMFVHLKGRSVKEAFAVGREIATAISEMNPAPVTLKMEKVYYPCFLLTKKRYVGYSYESPDQMKPMFDAKGIETVRRDTCAAVSKTLEQALRIYFEYQDIDKVKAYLQRQWTRILSGRVSLQDFVFAKEVRLGTYSANASSLPPSAIVATKAMRADPRAEPRYAERVPYVVVHGEPGARLVDMVVDPLDLLAINSPFRLNDIYYIRKQIIPALQRVFGLVGADLNLWFLEMPRPACKVVGKIHSLVPNPQRKRIDYYYLSKHCAVCGELVQSSAHLCKTCSENESMVAAALTGRTSKLEKNMQNLVAICRHCGGGDWIIESGVKCTSLACSVFYERRKVQKELQSLSEVSARTGFYPKCMVEWF